MAIIARHARYLLRRLVEIAHVFDTAGLDPARGKVCSCHNPTGAYRATAYQAPALAVADGTAHLTWRAGNETDDRVIAMTTPEAAIDATLLDAVSACMNGCIAHVPPAARARC